MNLNQNNYPCSIFFYDLATGSQRNPAHSGTGRLALRTGRVIGGQKPILPVSFQNWRLTLKDDLIEKKRDMDKYNDKYPYLNYLTLLKWVSSYSLLTKGRWYRPLPCSMSGCSRTGKRSPTMSLGPPKTMATDGGELTARGPIARTTNPFPLKLSNTPETMVGDFHIFGTIQGTNLGRV